MYSITLNKPIIALGREDAHISRMVQGIDYEKFRFYRYNDLQEFREKLSRGMKELGF